MLSKESKFRNVCRGKKQLLNLPFIRDVQASLLASGLTPVANKSTLSVLVQIM